MDSRGFLQNKIPHSWPTIYSLRWRHGSIVDQVLFFNFYSSVPSFNHEAMCFLIEICRFKITTVYAKYEIDHNFIPLSTTYSMMYVVF